MTTQPADDVLPSAPDAQPVRPPLRAPALLLICVAQLMATLDVTIVNLALPAVQGSLGLSNAGLAWVIDAYTLAYGGLLLVGGRAGDLLGHRRTLMIGIAVFTVSSAVAGLAQGPEVLLAARAGQGLGAALATPTTLSLITTLVPAGPRRTRAMVAYGSMAGIGITLGLVLGGVLTEYASWRWVFLINLPIGLVLLLAAPRLLPDTRGAQRRLDVVGALIGTGALLSLVYGVIRAGTDGWGDPVSTTALSLAAVLAVVFVIVERSVAEPTLPLGLLAHRVRLGAYVVAGLLFASLYPSFFLLSRVLQQVLGHDPLEAGLLFLPVGIGVLAFAIAARRLMAALGPRPLVLGGTVAAALGSAGLLALDVDSRYAAVLLPCLIGLGAGVGVTFVATSALSMTDVPEADVGIASALLSTFQAVGGTIGVAVVATLAARRTEDELTSAPPPLSLDVVREALLAGSGVGFVVTTALAAAAVLVALVTAPRRPIGGGVMSTPSTDRFYRDLATTWRPGELARVRRVEIRTAAPAYAWQVVHGSTDTLGRRNAVSGTVLCPRATWSGPGARPIVTYGVGVHGLGRDAAPSHLLRTDSEFELPLVERALDRGWAVAVSDGEGLGMRGPHTYGAGRAGGHALLDVARAAVRVVPELTPDSPVLLWGYSEGGRNAAWAAELQPTYARELPLVALGGRRRPVGPVRDREGDRRWSVRRPRPRGPGRAGPRVRRPRAVVGPQPGGPGRRRSRRHARRGRARGGAPRAAGLPRTDERPLGRAHLASAARPRAQRRTGARRAGVPLPRHGRRPGPRTPGQRAGAGLPAGRRGRHLGGRPR